MAYEKGDFYSGEFKQNIRDGKGTYIWPSGTVYEGNWESQKKNGTGVLFHLRKSWSYRGQFRDNKRHGTGIFHFESGNVYVGGFEANKRHGFGTLVSSPGDDQKVLKIGLWENDEFKD
jgi:hypothetical protein